MKTDNSDQSSSDSPSPHASTSSIKSQTQSTDVLMYFLVGLSISLGIYLFKTRDKHETSAKELKAFPPQDDEKDDSDDPKANQTLLETKDDVQESADSSHGQLSVELQSLKEKPPTPLFEILQADADTVKVAPESSDKDHEVVGDKEDKTPPRGSQLEREVKVYLLCYVIVALYQLYYL